MICEVRLIDGLSDQEVKAMFNATRDKDYEGLAKGARVLVKALRQDQTPAARADVKAEFLKL
jgi:hypothetical protein